MENYEFTSCSDGRITARNGKTTKVVSEYDRDIVSFVIEELKSQYKETYERLCNLYARYSRNRLYQEFLMAKRFIRCNLGNDDLLTVDIENGVMNLEFVQCPLRGECPDENLICCPKKKSPLSETQMKVARLYALGKGPKDIAAFLDKSPKTISNHLREIKKALKLKRVRDIITYDLIYKL